MGWTGYRAAQSVTVDSVGDSTLSGQSNLSSNDDLYLSTDTPLGKNNASDVLLLSDFGFNIPADSRVYRIRVRYEAYQEHVVGVGSVFLSFRLRKSVAAGTSERAFNEVLTDWPDDDNLRYINNAGAAGRLFNESVTPAEVNSSEFGLLVYLGNIPAAAATTHAHVDQIRVEIHYVRLIEADDVQVSASVDAGAVTPLFTALPDNVETPGSVDAVSIVEYMQVAPGALLIDNNVDAGTVQARYTANPVNVLTYAFVSPVNYTQAHEVRADRVTIDNYLEDVEPIDEAAIISPFGILANNALDGVAIDVKYDLAPNGLTNSNTADSVNVSAHYLFTPKNIAQSTSLEGVLFGLITVLGEVEGEIVICAAIDGIVGIAPQLDGFISTD